MQSAEYAKSAESAESAEAAKPAMCADASTQPAHSDSYLSVGAIHRELQEVSAKSESIAVKIKAMTEEIAKLKETLLIMTGAKLAFQKIVDASTQEPIEKVAS